MGWTLFYKGTLKDENDPSDVFGVVAGIAEEEQWGYEIDGDTMIVEFPVGYAEDLGFDLRSRSMDSWCKFFFEEEEEILAVFGLFYAIMPFFADYQIDDEYEAWIGFLAWKEGEQEV